MALREKLKPKSKPKSTRKIVWFARGGGIKQCGPFKSQIDATDAMRLATETDEEYAMAKANRFHPAWFRSQLNGGFPDDVFVWPEYEK